MKEKTKSDTVKSFNYPVAKLGLPQFMPQLYRPGVVNSFTSSGAYSYNLTSPRNPLQSPMRGGEQADDQSEKMDTSLSVSELHTEELPPSETYHQPHPQPQTHHSFFKLPHRPYVAHTSSSYRPENISYTSQLSPADQCRQVTLLLSELDTAKAQNKKVYIKKIISKF